MMMMNGVRDLKRVGQQFKICSLKLTTHDAPACTHVLLPTWISCSAKCIIYKGRGGGSALGSKTFYYYYYLTAPPMANSMAPGWSSRVGGGRFWSLAMRGWWRSGCVRTGTFKSNFLANLELYGWCLYCSTLRTNSPCFASRT